jgi:hypothetical protein
MSENKWVELKPISYIGILLGLGGILGPQLLNITDILVIFIGAIVSIFGWYLLLKGRKEHGL